MAGIPKNMDFEGKIRELEKQIISIRESARESEERYLALFNHSFDGVFICDFKGNFLDMSDVALRLTGYEKEDIKGLKFSDLLTEEQRTIAVKVLQDLLDTGFQKKPFEYLVRKKDGSTIWVETSSAVIYRNGKPYAVQGIARDITERKRADELLRERENHYRTMFEKTGNATILFGADTTIILANTNFAKLTGYSQEELEGKMSWTTFIAPEDLARMKGYHDKRRTDTSSAPESYEFVLITRTGERRDIFLSVALIPGTNESICSCMDITDRKLAEKALKESEDRYRNILDNMEEAYYEVNLAGDFTFFNARAVMRLGYTNDEMEGMNYRVFVDRENKKKLFETYANVYSTGKPIAGFDWEAISKKGERIPVESSVSLKRDNDGNIVGFRGVVRDITWRKKSEEDLRQSEERFKDLARLLPETVYECDKTGMLTFVNDAALEKFRYTREDFEKGLFALDMFMKEDKERGARNIQRVMSGEKVGINEYTALRKDGTTFPMLISSTAILKNSIPCGARGFIIDMSDKKNLEEQFIRAQKMEAIGSLAGGIAHDFNNLLMGILGNVSIMLMSMESSHPFFDRLKSMEEYVRQGSDLTRQFLGFARGGKYEVKPTHLGEFVRRSSEMFGRTKKEIRIHRKAQEKLWTVEVDRGQMEQVMLNIFVNAWQAMPGGGDLYLNVENVDLADEDVISYGIKPGRFVRISVMDTGTGMDEATMARIFEPFFTTKEKGRGTGLGLASVYGIVRNHKGFVTVDSERGAGSTFTIYLPASDKELQEEKTPEEDVRKGRETILLIDDEEMIIDIGTQMLESLGYRVLTAPGGKEGIEVYRQNISDIDLVLLDMIMPDIGGREAFERLKELNAEVKVLLSSGYSIEGQAEEIMEKGCRGFIQKPFSMGDLAGKIRKVLENDRQK